MTDPVPAPTLPPMNGHRVEKFPVVGHTPLRLSVVPEAIREHFGHSPAVGALPRDTLLAAGYEVLWDDQLYHAFHACLARALRARAPHLTGEDLA